jgi:hypothetical protein
MNKQDLSTKVLRERDFINSPKHDNSLRKFVDEHPDGAKDSVICKALCMTQKELEETYQCAILKLKEGLNTDE